MTDVVTIPSGVAGLLPIISGAIKAFQTIHAGVRIARKCVKHIADMELELEIQQVNFLNECVLLLRNSGEDEKTTLEMVANPVHVGWTNQSLEIRLEGRLAQIYSTCQKIIERIHQVQQELILELQGFDKIRSLRVKGESWRKTFRRVHDTIHFSFDKAEFEKKIKWFRRKNKTLESLRSHLGLLEQPRCSSRCALRRAIPGYYAELQQISDEAHGAISANFSCTESSHGEHSASLCLDAEVVDDICLSLAMGYTSTSNSDTQLEPSIKILLRSTRFLPICLPAESQDRGEKLRPNAIQTTDDEDGISAALLPAPSADKVLKKRKLAVLFANEKEPLERRAKLLVTTPSYTDLQSTSTGPSVNLSAIMGACQYLRRQEYVVVLQKPTSPKYIFHASRSHQVSSKEVTPLNVCDISLYDFLEAEKEESITIVHQFKLALKLAQAVLQYHSTPWLGSEWRLSQLRLMANPSKLPEEFTLHLKSKLPASLPTPPNTPETPNPNEVQMRETTKVILNDAQRRGITNTTLFCLGLAFLEVGYWKRLSDLFEEDCDSDDIDAARRLSKSRSILGERYDEIVRKCLQCNFGCATDLESRELQSAVYSDVVCPLQDLIEKLSSVSI